MSMIDRAIHSLRPNADWALSGDELHWFDAVQTKPSQTEIDDEVARLNAEEPTRIKSDKERTWRDAELAKADIELFKVQDGRGTGDVQDWRDYRNALRDYPEQADFPNGTRPKLIIS